MKIAMTNKEAALFEAFLRGSTNYLEFGAGGSTHLAARFVKNRIISVDSSEVWLDSVRRAVLDIATDNQPEIALKWVDIGETGEWGYPTNETKKANWHLYSTAVWQTPGADKSDIFLIDGRFRVACFAEALIRAAVGSIVIIHDFESRENYHVVLNLARRIAVADQLSIFVKDGRADIDEARRVADQYRLSLQ